MEEIRLVIPNFTGPNYIPLKDLPNRKVCPLPGCECSPVMEKINIPNPFGDGAPVQVDAPRCANSGTSLATMEEGCYGQLIACRDLILMSEKVTGEQANIVRRCLGNTHEDMATIGVNSKRAEEYKETHQNYSLILLGLVCKQIHKYES